MDGKCLHCGAAVEAGDRFCPNCGKAPRRPVPRRRGRHAERARVTSMARAAAWILILAVLFALGGLVMGFMTKSELDPQLRVLRGVSPDTPLLTDDGHTTTAAEQVRLLEFVIVFVFATHFGLAAIYFALWFWARRDPLPPILIALSVLVALKVLTVVVEPALVLSGIVIQVIAFLALLGGLRAALAQRSLARAAAAEAPPPA